ncbi:hypothetical protein [Virgibacillus sp. MG-45]|uniref:hypothetical protein n=1 Tax=Virgibacillus sp. MG-45 TaxID=3102791 RepID=UPI003FCC9928
MYYDDPSYIDYDDRQFNFTGMMNQMFPGMWPGGAGFPGQQPPAYPPFPGGPGFPGQPGGVNPPFPGGGGFPGQPGGMDGGPPTSPPPAFEPQQPSMQTFAVDPGAIRRCLYRYTYIWLRRSSFWFYPVFIGRNSIAGYRWQRNRWVYFGIDLDRIQSFQCF